MKIKVQSLDLFNDILRFYIAEWMGIKLVRWEISIFRHKPFKLKQEKYQIFINQRD